MGCMRPISENAVICPHCAYNSQSVQQAPYLKKGTVLKENYIVGKLLSASSDCTTYIGYDCAKSRTVKVIEFLPEKLITRQTGKTEITVKENYKELYGVCLSSFVNLWKTIGEIGNPLAVDEVYDIFNSGNTAYAICEYTEGITLRDFFDARGRCFSWSEAYHALLPIMSAVSKLHHMGTVHAEISPATIYVTKDGKFRLSGFGIPQSHGSVPELNRLPVGGYAPIERYDDPQLLSASSDVYSLACIFYTAVTGEVPMNAQKRITDSAISLPLEIQKRISPEAVEAFRQAVQVFPASRLKTVEELINSFGCKEIEPVEFVSKKEEPNVLLSGYDVKPSPTNTEPPASVTYEPPSEEKESSVLGIIIKSFVSVIIIAALIFTTLYTTFLYKKIDIPFYDNLLGSFSFLPMNIESEEDTAATTEAQTTSPEIVSVADFTALSYEYIKQNAIFAQNYDLVYEFQYSDTYKKNEIISQSIPAGEDVEVGTTITIYVSRGKRSVVLRDVIGMNYDSAYAILTEDGFVVLKRNLKNDGTQTSGEVYTMSLVAGLEFEYGTEVVLSVWE